MAMTVASAVPRVRGYHLPEIELLSAAPVPSLAELVAPRPVAEATAPGSH